MSEVKKDIPTFSEMQRTEMRINRCPKMGECKETTSKHFFNHYCDTGAYTGCMIFARMMNESLSPNDWLLKLYIPKGDDR